MFIEGKRIYLREVTERDVNSTYYAWLCDPEITKYLECRFFPQSMERIREYVDSLKSPDNVFLAIETKEGGVRLGNIRLGPINWIHRFSEIGLIIGEKDYWNKGYGTEAISLVRDYAFSKLSLHKLTAGCYLDNIASIKAFEKAGFVREGLLRCQYLTEWSRYCDEAILGCLADEHPRNPQVLRDNRAGALAFEDYRSCISGA